MVMVDVVVVWLEVLGVEIGGEIGDVVVGEVEWR